MCLKNVRILLTSTVALVALSAAAAFAADQHQRLRPAQQKPAGECVDNLDQQQTVEERRVADIAANAAKTMERVGPVLSDFIRNGGSVDQERMAGMLGLDPRQIEAKSPTSSITPKRLAELSESGGAVRDALGAVEVVLKDMEDVNQELGAGRRWWQFTRLRKWVRQRADKFQSLENALEDKLKRFEESITQTREYTRVTAELVKAYKFRSDEARRRSDVVQYILDHSEDFPAPETEAFAALPEDEQNRVTIIREAMARRIATLLEYSAHMAQLQAAAGLNVRAGEQAVEDAQQTVTMARAVVPAAARVIMTGIGIEQLAKGTSAIKNLSRSSVAAAVKQAQRADMAAAQGAQERTVTPEDVSRMAAEVSNHLAKVRDIQTKSHGSTVAFVERMRASQEEMAAVARQIEEEVEAARQARRIAGEVEGAMDAQGNSIAGIERDAARRGPSR